MLIDTHCHLHDPRFDTDRVDAFARARSAGVSKMINIGCDFETTLAAKDLAQAHEDAYFSAGFHPHEAQLAPPDFIEKLREIASHPKCVAIGECGLDFYYDHSPRSIQHEVFEAQITLAKELNKPLVIHVRDAWPECIAVLEKQSSLPTLVIHCFTGTLEQAKKCLELGAMISISGVVTFKNAAQLVEAVQFVPLERLLIETDSPYLAPIPHRGQRNEPAYVLEVAKKVAEIKGLELAEVQSQTTKNAMRTFALE